VDEYQPQPTKSWWGRNWIWVVPLGCLTPVVLMIGCGVAAYFAVSGLIKSSDVYVHSLAAVSSNDAVKDALGEPIAKGLGFQGNVSLNNNDGQADITYNITGSKGAGTVHVVAEKHDGVWTYQTNKVHINSTNEDIEVPVEANDLAR
jgi:hypothetical protein